MLVPYGFCSCMPWHKDDINYRDSFVFYRKRGFKIRLHGKRGFWNSTKVWRWCKAKMSWLPDHKLDMEKHGIYKSKILWPLPCLCFRKCNPFTHPLVSNLLVQHHQIHNHHHDRSSSCTMLSTRTVHLLSLYHHLHRSCNLLFLLHCHIAFLKSF